METTTLSQLPASSSSTAEPGITKCHVRPRQGFDTDDIASFVQSLSRQGLRQLKEVASQINLNCDVIGKIPLELIPMVFQHLPIYQCFQARRVSRCWSERLVSRQVLEPHLRGWYRKDEIENHNIARVAQKIDAYQHISPFSMAICDVRCNWYTSNVAYGDGILSWIDGDEPTKCKLQRLSGSGASDFSSPDGTKLERVAVSASMAAAVDESDICHVWDLRLPSQPLVHSFQAELQHCPTVAQEMRIAKQTLVIRTSKRIMSIQLGSPIKTYELSPLLDYWRCSIRIMLDHSGQHISLFSLDRRDGRLIRTQYDPQWNIERENSLLCQSVMSYDWSESTQTVLQDYCTTVWTLMKRQPPNVIETSSWDILRICYNQREQQLELHNHTVHGLRSKDEITSAFVMNDVVYCRSSWFHLGSEKIELNAINIRTSSCTRASIQADPCALSWPFNVNLEMDEERAVADLMGSIFLGDETFLINFSCAGMIIWCFEKDIKMPWGAPPGTDEGASLETDKDWVDDYDPAPVTTL